MSTFGEANRQLDEAEARLSGADERLARLKEVAGTLGELVGRGEAADGQVVVEWASGGVRDITLNPRVMRMASGDLADALKEAIAAATADLRAQVQQTLGDAGVAAEKPPSVDELREQMRALGRQIVGNGRASLDEIERAARVRRGGV